MLSLPSLAKKISVCLWLYVDAADIKKVLGTVSASTEDADINRLLESVKGKKIEDLIAEGSKKIGSTAPSAGSAPVAK